MGKSASKPTKSVVERNFYICDENYQQLVDLSFQLKTRNIGNVIDHVLNEHLTDERMHEMMNSHINTIKQMLELRFTENLKILPKSPPRPKSSSRRFFRISSRNAERLEELSYVSNKPAYILLNEIISDYLKNRSVEM